MSNSELLVSIKVGMLVGRVGMPITHGKGVVVSIALSLYFLMPLTNCSCQNLRLHKNHIELGKRSFRHKLNYVARLHVQLLQVRRIN